jgi:hypothetical protein
MALVFISHAHGDEALARSLVNFLRDALKLEQADFFVSSQGGRGVAPAASIRDEILKTLQDAPSLVVLVTPKSAGSPWVWLEAGHRLGRPDRSNPLFLVPSKRFVNLLQPVADLRSLCLDDDDDLFELLKAVGASLGKPPQDVLDYKEALRQLAVSAAAAYSPGGERKARAVAWLRANAVALLIATAAIVGVGFYSKAKVAQLVQAVTDEAQARISELEDKLRAANVFVNDEVAKTAARYLVLKGVVLSDAGRRPIGGARVMASLNTDVGAACDPPDCIHDTTTTEGQFRLDLTQIGARSGDDIRLSVSAAGFEVSSRLITLDVRAMDGTTTAHTVTIKPARNPGGPEP